MTDLRVGEKGGDIAGARREAVRSRQQRLAHSLRLPRVRLPAGWPLAFLIVGFPVWWILGMRVIIFPVLAIPMALELLRRRPIKVPPYFGLWLLFLLWFVVSTAMLGYSPPNTLGEVEVSGVLSLLLRFAEYVSITIMFLYAGNLTESELPRARIIRMLAYFFVVVVVGGLFALALPKWEMTSPVELLLPSDIEDNPFVESLVHPVAAQVHTVLGYELGRPAAPFGYTNMWGNALNILLPWFVVGWMTLGSHARRTAAPFILCAALLPAIYSLNRGLWIGLVLSGLYFGVRLAARGKLWALGTVGFVTAGASLVFAVSPLQDVVESRLANPHSNDVRAFTMTHTITASTHSPVIGYGNPRKARGSANSIAIGSSPACPQCGNPVLGSTGQLWLVLISQGYVGTLLYVSFFLGTLLRFGRDPTPTGMSATLVVLLSFFYMLIYNALAMPLLITMLSIVLLWRNDIERRKEADQPPTQTATAGRRPLGRLAGVRP